MNSTDLFKGLKFKERETTENIALVFMPEFDNLSKNEIARKQLCNGKFNLGYHYILRKSGELEKGIPLKQYGDPYLYGYKTSIIVCVTTPKIVDTQKMAMDFLKNTYKLPVITTAYEQ